MTQPTHSPTKLDELDKRILAVLQTNANLPLKDIAEQVFSSPATCQRRILALQKSGVIVKQVAIVNPQALGLELSVFVLVELDRQSARETAIFEQLINEQKQVSSCYEISGDYDFMLLLHCKNMSEYLHFTRAFLTHEHNVVRFKSQFVMNFSKINTKIEF